MKKFWFIKNEQQILQCIFSEAKCDCCLCSTNKNIQFRLGASVVFEQLCERFAQQQQTGLTQDGIAAVTGYSVENVKKVLKKIDQQLTEIGVEKWFNSKKLFDGVECKKIYDDNDAFGDLAPTEEFAQKIQFHGSCGYRSKEYFTTEFKEYITNNKKTYIAVEGRRIVFLYGPGGSGKTYYMKNLWLYFNKELKIDAYYCSLPALLQKAITNPIPKEKHCNGDISKASYFQNNVTSYLFKHFGISEFNRNKRYAFFFDGVNELIAQNTSLSYDFLQQILSEIRMIIAENVTVVISSRSKKDFAFLGNVNFEAGEINSVKCHFATLSGVECDLPDDMTEEIRTLLSRPLFYSLYRKMPKEQFPNIDSKYELWNFFHQSACRQAFKGKNINADEILYMYYVLLPAAAYWCACNRKEEIQKFDFIQITDKIRNSLAIQERYHCIINSIEKSIEKYNNEPERFVERSEIHFNKLSPIYYDEVRNIRDFAIISDDGSIRFAHQDIKEYFAAFYIVSYLSEIKNPSVPLLLEMIPSFNLNSDIQNTIMEVFGFEKKNDEKNSMAFKKLFGQTKKLVPSTSMEDLKSQFHQNITHAYAAYTFADHFMLHINQARHEVISPFCMSILKYADFFKDWKDILSRNEKNALVEVFTAMIQYYRIKLDYKTCRQYYEFAKEFLIEGADTYYCKMIEHHKAKAMICNSQSLYCSANYVSLWDKNLSAKALFDGGMTLLYDCLPYNMSVNLLGNILAKPVLWIENNGLSKRNLCEAFRIYRDFFEKMTNPEINLWLLNGTELIYTTREMLSLLVKFYVYIDENGDIHTYDSTKDIVDLESLKKMMPACTLSFINEVLKKVIGQKYDFMDWVRGMALLLSGKDEEAEIMFENENNNQMTWIIKYMQGEISLKPEIDKKLTEFSSKINKTNAVDQTDKKYLLMDALQLGYKFEHPEIFDVINSIS